MRNRLCSGEPGTIAAMKAPPFLAAILAVLAACSGGQQPKVDENRYPSGYKSEIIRVLPEIVNNAAGVGDAGVTEPALVQFGNTPRYAVCVRYTPRKGHTETLGTEERIAIFHGGSLTQIVVATREQCGNAVYQPFPELEKICLGGGCSKK